MSAVATREWIRPGLEVALAVVALVFAVVCAMLGTDTEPYRAVAEGAPPFEVTAYTGSWIVTSAVLFAVAGVLVVDAIRLRIDRRDHNRE